MLNNKCFLNKRKIGHYRDNFFTVLFLCHVNWKGAVGQIPKRREIMFADGGTASSYIVVNPPLGLLVIKIQDKFEHLNHLRKNKITVIILYHCLLPEFILKKQNQETLPEQAFLSPLSICWQW